MLDSVKIETSELITSESAYLANLFKKTKYPWELLSNIEEYIKEISLKYGAQFSEISKGIFVGEGVVIADNAVIEPPVIIGKGTVIRSGAYIRGRVIIGEGCVIGNSSEIKNSILSDKVEVPHYNYVGDSVLGYHAHMGAGAICSNLKLDGKNITLKIKDKTIETGLRKFGAILGDNVDVGCNSVLNPGVVIGKGCVVYPLSSLRGVYPENSIIKDMKTVIKKETGLCAE